MSIESQSTSKNTITSSSLQEANEDKEEFLDARDEKSLEDITSSSSLKMGISLIWNWSRTHQENSFEQSSNSFLELIMMLSFRKYTNA